MAERWRRCSACKKDIALGAIHWVCSVSTCNRKRTALVFCSVDCWEIHLPTERHREAWAVEARAPNQAEPPEGEPRRRRAKAPPGATIEAGAAEVLVVASRLKSYIKTVSGLSTSDGVLFVLSEALRGLCDESMENARRAERLTVLERDVPRK
jgi:hypothetical protein